ncbi:hypothetical protein C8F04DRAFT_1268754 [Mycena alexandri]|uniref:Uncharacterized protein n=1 Tax=Mycena alexandri TaxID=1745969 RepID=A0AAD6SFM7_9AGAR|nr:hypothetical protein C8F04DRAFT_1268754 [Mycena alexandri]
MLNPYLCVALLLSTTGAFSSYIPERDILPYGSVDGIHVPSTTDLPAPGTTDKASKIASEYSEYIYKCGKAMQITTGTALGAYKLRYNSSIDTTSPDFIVWAFNNYQLYQEYYLVCQEAEEAYQSMLSTFIPDTTFATSTKPTASPVASSANSQQSTKVVGNGSGAEPSKGGAMSSGAGIRVVAGAVLFIAGLLS